jgi:DNA-3-methyladenine glycosylase II
MKKAIQHLRHADPVIAGIIERVGPYRVKYNEPVFGSLVRSIVYQQLSGKAAATIFGRLAAATGEPIHPEPILRLTFEELRSIGLSRQKATYIRDLAEKTASEQVVFEKFRRMTNDQIIGSLTQVKGIGVWTVQMFLMFSLRRPDVLPCGDLGIRNAVQKAYKLESPPAPDKLQQIGERWRPYCTVASWYLWRSLEL